MARIVSEDVFIYIFLIILSNKDFLLNFVIELSFASSIDVNAFGLNKI